MRAAGMGRQVAGAAGAARPWVEPAARLGYAAKGVVYLIVGLLATQAALGRGGGVGDSRDAFDVILRQPLGRVLLGTVGVGLLGNVLWQLLAAALDTEGKGRDAKGIAARLGHVGRALVYAVLGVEALRLAAGSGGGGGGGDGAEHWAARLLDLPFGRVLLGLAGAGIVAYGLWQIYGATSDAVRKHLDLHALDGTSARWAVRASRAGIAARGVVFAMIGWLTLRAALDRRAGEAGGTGDALRTLASGDHGAWLLGLVGLGLIAYALHQFLNARYRVMRV